MLTQTLAIFTDAYRELNARKLFWITLGLSGLVVAVCACLGVNERGLTFLAWEIPTPPGFDSTTTPPAVFYKLLFTSLGIGIWLTWAAMILALVSTASIFPEFVSGGSIELTLSKPIGRLRLFITKYIAGLLFVALQVGLFSTACFFLIGLRGQSWEPRVFLAIPIVVAVFSYLFSIMALLGIVTRSTIASLLVTLLIWLGLFLINTADSVTVMARERAAMQVEFRGRTVERLERRVDRLERTARVRLEEQARIEGSEVGPLTPEALEAESPELVTVRAELERARRDMQDAERSRRTAQRWARGAAIVKTVLPKTAETGGLLERSLLSKEDLERMQRNRGDNDFEEGFGVDQQELGSRVQDAFRSRPTWWVVGTSLGFEVVILGIAGFIFCRRDF